MNIFLTGGSGFVGSHLLNQLLELNHTVYALVRTPRKITIKHPNLKLIKGDLESDFLFDEIQNIDLVIHTAGIVHSYDSNDFYKINYKGTQDLIKRFSSNQKLKFIFISSLASRGPFEDEPIDRPVSDYGKSKNMAEQYLMNEASHNWTKIIIRPPMVIGPRDTAVLDVFKMVKDGVILLPGLDSKKKLYSFVCVFDLVNTILKSIELNQSTVLYSSFPSNISFEELIIKIQTHLKKDKIHFLAVPKFLIFIAAYLLTILHKIIPHQLRLTPDKIRELFPKKWVCDSSYTRTILNQTFKYDLEKTIQITAKDYKDNNWI